MAGCVTPVIGPSINEAAIRVLNRHGIEVVIPAEEGCCGALAHHMGKEHAALRRVATLVAHGAPPEELFTAVVEEVREAPVRPVDEHSGDAELTSPMPGSVVAVGVADGEYVDAGARTVLITWACEAAAVAENLRSFAEEVAPEFK